MKTRLYVVSSLGIAISLKATVSTTCKLRSASSVEMLKLMSTLLGIGMKKKWRRTFLYPLNYLKKKLRKKTQVNHLHLHHNNKIKNYHHQSILQEE